MDPNVAAGESPVSTADVGVASGSLAKWLVISGAGLVIATAMAAVWVSKLDERADLSGPPLPVIKDVPAFSLIERSGQPLTKDDLLGKIWVVDFIFTSCAGPCPLLSTRMFSLQQSLDEFGDQVKLVSISVDPRTDRPEVLRKYAERYHAEDDRWFFLTGDDEEAIYAMIREGFLSAVEPAKPGGAIIHSTSFLLVDGQGRIRMRYEGVEPGSKKLILRDIRKLLAEAASP